MTRPEIRINFAISADGKITSVAGIRSGWTSSRDHQRLLDLRGDADALMVARGTLEADRMTLRAPHHPRRCVVSRQGHFDPAHPLFHTPGGPIHLLATEADPPAIPGTHRHRSSLADFLFELRRDFAVRTLHCEGGGQLVRELATLDAIDHIHLTWAGHRLFGGLDAPGILGAASSFLPASRRYQLAHVEPLEAEGECFLSYRRAQ